MDRTIIRSVSFLLIPCLAADSATAAVVADRFRSLPPLPLTIPARWGQITDYYNGSNEPRVITTNPPSPPLSKGGEGGFSSSPMAHRSALVVLIQDLHGNPGVQRNIAEILKHLAKHIHSSPLVGEGRVRGNWRSPSPSSRHGESPVATSCRPIKGEEFQSRHLTVFVEGASGPFDVGLLRNHPNRWIREHALRRMLTDRDISGAEIAAIEVERPLHLWGVDDKALYLRNLKAFSIASVKGPVPHPGNPIWKDYYATAKERDVPLALNALAHIDLLKKTAAPPTMVALVAGGYHTAGTAQILKANGFPYVVVAPQVDSLGDEHLYAQRLRELSSQANHQALAIALVFSAVASRNFILAHAQTVLQRLGDNLAVLDGAYETSLACLLALAGTAAGLAITAAIKSVQGGSPLGQAPSPAKVTHTPGTGFLSDLAGLDVEALPPTSPFRKDLEAAIAHLKKRLRQKVPVAQGGQCALGRLAGYVPPADQPIPLEFHEELMDDVALLSFGKWLVKAHRGRAVPSLGEQYAKLDQARELVRWDTALHELIEGALRQDPIQTLEDYAKRRGLDLAMVYHAWAQFVEDQGREEDDLQREFQDADEEQFRIARDIQGLIPRIHLAYRALEARRTKRAEEITSRDERHLIQKRLILSETERLKLYEAAQKAIQHTSEVYEFLTAKEYETLKSLVGPVGKKAKPARKPAVSVDALTCVFVRTALDRARQRAKRYAGGERSLEILPRLPLLIARFMISGQVPLRPSINAGIMEAIVKRKGSPFDPATRNITPENRNNIKAGLLKALSKNFAMRWGVGVVDVLNVYQY